MRQIAQGLDYLHAQSVIHSDLHSVHISSIIILIFSYFWTVEHYNRWRWMSSHLWLQLGIHLWTFRIHVNQDCRSLQVDRSGDHESAWGQLRFRCIVHKRKWYLCIQHDSSRSNFGSYGLLTSSGWSTSTYADLHGKNSVLPKEGQFRHIFCP